MPASGPGLASGWSGGGSAANASISAEDADSFAADEVEAARIMFDAFRATKGPDGERIDTARWSAETEARVEVRANAREAPTRAPHDSSGLGAQRAPGSRSFGRRSVTPTPPPGRAGVADTPPLPVRSPPTLPPSLSQEIVAAARRGASADRSDAGRASLLLVAKRDLYLLAFRGVVDLLKSGDAPDSGAVLEAIEDIFRDICDDWRELCVTHRAALEDAEAKLARAEADAEEAMARCAALEDRVADAEREAAAARDDAERARLAAGGDANDAGSRPSDASPNRANKTPRSPLAPSTVSPAAKKRESSAAAAGKTTARSKSADVDRRSRRAALEASLLQARAASLRDSALRAPFEEKNKNDAGDGGRPPPRWAIDTAPVAAAAAAARGASRGGAGQFGPDRSLTQPPRSANARVRTDSPGSLTGPTPTRRGGDRAPGEKGEKAPSVKRWSLKQLKEVLEDVVSAKAKSDATRRAHKQPPETMREHLFTYLNQKFGVRAIVDEWAASVVAATEAHADSDCETAAFGRALANFVDEGFVREQRVVSSAVDQLVLASVRSRARAGASDAEIKATHERKMRGDLLEEEWLDVVRFMYGRADGAAIVRATRRRQRERSERDFASAMRRLTLENQREGVERRSSEALRKEAEEASRPKIAAREFTQICLFHGLATREDALRPVAEALRHVGCLRSGVVPSSRFKEVCALARPDMSERDAEEALLALDPWNSGRITASDAYAALTPGLESEEKEKAAEEVGGNQGEHNRGVLGGGVGHAKERFFS